MADIQDSSSTFTDNEFQKLWEELDIQPRLNEVYHAAFSSEFSHRTVKQTYLNLINAHREKMQRFFLDDNNESARFEEAVLELQRVLAAVNRMRTHDEAVEAQETFYNVFHQVCGEENIEEKLKSHWEALERNARETLKNLQEYVKECSKATINIEQALIDGTKQYDEKRYLIVAEAEKKTVEYMTARYHNIRISVLQKLRKFLQEKSEEHLQQQIQKLINTHTERGKARTHLAKLRSKLSTLRIRYYSEPIDKAGELDELRDQVHKNDQEIALLSAQLKSLEANTVGMEPIDSVRVECSPVQTTPIYDVSPVERAQGHKRNRVVNLAQVVQRLKVPQMNFEIESQTP
ncbi:unnamed protein product [Bursaphelenchus okinawaensis]|uniref:Uncharacterized protein n=1 Tax=Bursaphelenchus okinawaensis TaxID=465554 RepID=A0A811LU84_9BILA|nr:unnamed protein product [Bursaphelenchus okinawaensis]CAG9128148.1 unnamed protein product [Bursaphelenchus okinawaensis]